MAANKTAPLTPAQVALLDRREAQLLYDMRVKRASGCLISLVQLFMPDPNGIRAGDILATRFKPGAFHHYLAGKLGGALDMPGPGKKFKHIGLSVPAQHGKTTLASIAYLCVFIGRNPHLNILFASYSEDAARTIGLKVKVIVQSKLYKRIFPGFALRADSKSAETLTTTEGGSINFIGLGGAGTGKPADLIVIDDPIKGSAQARSLATVVQLHEWYDSVMDMRAHNRTRQIVIHTRWIVDDLLGRLCDPTHPDHDVELAAMWDYINFPAVNTDPLLASELGQILEVQEEGSLARRMFGDKPMAALWGERFDLNFLARRKRKNPRVFEALMQGNPTPEDGEKFQRDRIRFYDSPDEIPKEIRKYGASDHALTVKRENDPSCLGVIGVDEHDNCWCFPDLFWDRAEPDGLVSEIVSRIATHRPDAWFGEGDLIGKALGPAIRKEMVAQRAYTNLHSIPTIGDKSAKSANFQARVSLGKIYLPRFAPWCNAAVSQMLKFPNDKNDDFVDFFGIFCRGLDFIYGPMASRPGKPQEEIEYGTFAWLQSRSKLKKRDDEDIRKVCRIEDYKNAS